MSAANVVGNVAAIKPTAFVRFDSVVTFAFAMRERILNVNKLGVDMIAGDFITFKVGCITVYGVIDSIKGDGTLLVSYHSKTTFMSFKEKYGIVNIPHGLEGYAEIQPTEAKKIEGMPNWNDL